MAANEAIPPAVKPAYPRFLTAPPAGFYLLWVASAILAAGGLVLLYGFREPVLATQRIRYFLLASAALFALSRLLLFIPAWTIRHRLKTWWVDFVLLAAAVAWRIREPAAEPVILKIAGAYTLLTGAGVWARSIIRAFVDEYAQRGLTRPTLKLFLGSVLLSVIGGAVLSLPACWAKPVTGEKATQHARHIQDCFFTATASLTGTGLAVRDIQHEFTRAGQIVIVILMQIGGLAVLLLAGLASLRFYTQMGWRSEAAVSRHELIRFIRFIFGITLLCEAAGGLALYQLWQPAETDEAGRILNAAFHTVSAFCTVGLTLPSDALIGQAGSHMSIVAILSFLMLTGTLGGPVLYDLLRRRSSTPTRVTILGLVVLTLLGTGLLFAIESSPKWQLRNPRDDTPGRLRLSGGTELIDGALVFSSEDTIRTRTQRMRTMSSAERAVTAYFTTVSSLGGGMPAARLDEASLSPASRVVLMTWMLIGGGLGGTAGGIRIVIVYLIVAAVFGRRSSPAIRPLGVGTAAAIAGGILLLTLTTALLLTYREAGTFEACTFEAISATCNVGLSAGLTAQLTVEGRVLIILSMLLGRAIPIGILLRPDN